MITPTEGQGPDWPVCGASCSPFSWFGAGSEVEAGLFSVGVGSGGSDVVVSGGGVATGGGGVVQAP
jgi:hypothetical protein